MTRRFNYPPARVALALRITTGCQPIHATREYSLIEIGRGRGWHALSERTMTNKVVSTTAILLSSIILMASASTAADGDNLTELRLATFAADVTCPIGHPLLGGLYDPATQIVDPLFARGIVLSGAGSPIVLCAVDWCEIRNGSFDAWRESLADAAETSRERVLVCSLHQHDAPVTDLSAARLLSAAGLAGAMFDIEFERACIERTAAALREGLKESQIITHLGIGQSKVERIASNRRVVREDGSVHYHRGSNSGGDAYLREAPDGSIDPLLKTLSFWNGDRPIAALHAYAVHPMSYYGKGGVSADFVGLARRIAQQASPSIFQIYVSGCSGDVTAGKYNDGSPANRTVLADRLWQAIKRAQVATRRLPLKEVNFRNTQLVLPFRRSESHTAEALQQTVANSDARKRDRILAAMGLASLQRTRSGQAIDFPCIDFGTAQILLFPGETWVGYQLKAQEQRPNSHVISIGYGECWPGYIPTAQGFVDRFDNVWYWVGPGSDQLLNAALERVLPKEGTP